MLVIMITILLKELAMKPLRLH